MIDGTSGSQPAVLSCTGLIKSFGERLAVSEVGFEVAPGETYGLLGPNGAGKTTTISLICGLLKRDAGSVCINGFDLDTDTSQAKATLGYVPQDLAIYPDLTAAENLKFFGRLYGLAGSDLARSVEEVLETIGLTDRAGERTDQFSGGMKRRLNIGVGLLHRPQLLILDEPTVGVDPQSRDAILASVGRLGAEGIGVIYTTHYMEEAERLCDRIGIIDEGRLIAEGTRRELITLIDEHDWIRLTIDAKASRLAEDVANLTGVVSTRSVDHTLAIEVENGQHALPGVMQLATSLGVGVSGVELIEPDLETVFLHLTGRALRD